jgi:hypothetical protein
MLRPAQFFIVMALAFLTGCASAGALVDPLTLTPEHFRSTVTIDDDALEAIATIDTFRGLPSKYDFGAVVYKDVDSSLRGFIDKKTGLRRYQVYTRIEYRDEGWHFYRSANYGSPVVTKELTKIASKVESCSGRGSCRYVETVGFNVTEAELRAAAQNVSGDGKWVFRLKSRSGPDYDGWLPVAELTGFLQAMDDYSQKLKTDAMRLPPGD